MAKICIFEDDDNISLLVKRRLKKEGHEVILEIESLEEAIEVIKKNLLNESGIDVVILDRHLLPQNNNRDDGKTITELIRKQNPQVKIIGLSEDSMADLGIDYDLRKRGMSEINKIVKLLT